MINSIVSIDELRNNLAELIGRVMYGGDRVIIKKYNREAAVVLSIDEYERLIDPTKRFSPKIWKSKFKAIDKIRESIPEIDSDVIEREVNKAVQAVRAERRAK